MDGTIATLRFNADDPESVQDAIRQMEAAVDAKVAPYRGNALVAMRIDVAGFWELTLGTYIRVAEAMRA